MPAAPIADAPPSTLAPFHGPSTTVRQMVKHVAGPRGERSVLVRNVTEHAIRHVRPKDYLSEILAVRNFVAEHCYFTNDALTTEWVKDPERICEEIVRYGKARIDCDDYASLLAAMLRSIGREVEFVVVGFNAPGQYSHVLCRVKEPKTGKWIVVDPVAGTAEGRMLRRVRTSKVVQIGAAAPNAVSGLGQELFSVTLPKRDITAEPHPERYPKCVTYAQLNEAKQECRRATEIRGLDGMNAPFTGANPCWVETLSLCPGQRPPPTLRAKPPPPPPPAPTKAAAPTPAPSEMERAGVSVGGLLLAALAIGGVAYFVDRRRKA